MNTNIKSITAEKQLSRQLEAFSKFFNLLNQNEIYLEKEKLDEITLLIEDFVWIYREGLTFKSKTEMTKEQLERFEKSLERFKTFNNLLLDYPMLNPY